MDLTVLLPEVIVLLGALIALFGERISADRGAAVIGLVATGAATAAVWLVPVPRYLFGTMLSFGPGPAGLVVRSAICALTFLFLAWVTARGWSGERPGAAVSMVLFAVAGGMLLVSANDLVVLFMGLELATMPAYVLIGFSRDEERSLEAALKYFLLSVLTSVTLAYGLSFIYGMNGTTAYLPVEQTGGLLALFAGSIVMVGLLAKITAAPFHFWSPDAYEGASIPSVAFVASVAKIGPLYALVKFVAVVLPAVSGLSTGILAVAVVSMILGNVVALVQTDLRRMVAYSGIANAGYMMLGLAAHSVAGYASTVFFVVIYAVSVLGLLLVVAQEGPTLQDVAGLVRTRAYAAWCAVGFLFSLIGFPPMVGFFGKLTVFGAAFGAGEYFAVVVAILMSVVSAGYAFRVIRAMFTPGEGAPEMVEREPIEKTATVPQWPVLAATVILVLAILTIALGVATQPLVSMLAAALV